MLALPAMRVSAQFFECHTESLTQNENSGSTHCWPDNQPPCEETLNFAPDPDFPEHTPIKYVKVVLHIFQNQNAVFPPGNFSNSQYDLDILRSWFHHPTKGINARLANLCDPQPKVPGNESPHIPDARVQFLFDGIENQDVFFYEDATLWGGGFYCGNQATYYGQLVDAAVNNNPVVQNNPNILNSVHVFMVGASVNLSSNCYNYGGGGYTYMFTSCGNYLPGIVLYGQYYQYLFDEYELDPTGNTFGAHTPDPSNIPFIGSGILHEWLHIATVDHPGTNSHIGGPNPNTNDGCDDTPYPTTENNMMDSSLPTEQRCALTQCQLGRMHHFLQNNQPVWLRTAENNFTYPAVTQFCQTSLPDIEIPNGADMEWKNPRQLRSNLIVRSGGKLTIRCDVGMPGDARILVEPNGELFIEGARIYNNCSGDLWQGIIVQGNPAQHQYKLFGQRYQGFVSMQDATVEGAEVAVRLYDPANPLGTSGGVVVATNSSFYNNLQAVSFTTYHNFNPLNGNKPAGNLSRFSECTFDIDDEFQGGLKLFRAHASLRNVEGVYFTSCNFSNNSSVSNLYQRGDGIKAFQAGFTVNAKCTSGSLPCEGYLRGSFRGFDTGVRVSLGRTAPFRISRTDFSGNGRGVFAFKSDLAYVVLNDIEVGSPYAYPDGSPFSGIQLSNCTGYKVEENNLQPLPSGLPANAKTIGILIQSSGPQPNEEYKNTFAALDYASLANGQNKNPNPFILEGLQYRCNDNSAGNLKYDFAVPEENWNPYAGVAGNQGSLDLASGNSLTPNPLLPETHFLNQSSSLTYFYQFGEEPINYSVQTITKIPAQPNSCPSKLPNKEDKLGENEKQQYQSEVTSGGTAHEMSFAANMLVRDYLVDSSAIDYDSARLWLAAKGYLYDHFLIVDTWLQQQEPDSAQAALDAIPQSVLLEGQDQVEYGHFSDLKSLQISAQRQGQTEQQMADTYETTLAGIANAGEYYASAQAQNLLNEYKGYNYQPAIILPSGGQQGLKLPKEVTIQQTEGLQMRAMPNPARDYTDFHFRLPAGVESARLIIRDLDGKTIESFLIDDQTGSISWNTAKVRGGVYLYSIEADGVTTLTKRLIIVK